MRRGAKPAKAKVKAKPPIGLSGSFGLWSLTGQRPSQLTTLVPI